MRQLHERHPVFQKTSSKQAVSSQVMLAVPFDLACRFLGDVKHILLVHQLFSLLEGIGKCFRNGCSATIQKPFADLPTEIISGLV
jgi:hypothetical protein